MKLDPSPSVQVLDRASLERFTTDLIEAGFHAAESTGLQDWVGPLPECFHQLTAARTMLIRIRHGWPFVHPQAVVKGISGEHTGAGGIICLWAEDDQSCEWLRYEGLTKRAAEWCDKARNGFTQIDEGLDAYLGFEFSDDVLVTFDLARLVEGVSQDGKHQRVHGVQRNPKLLELHHGNGSAGSLPGRLFYRASLPAPPRTLGEFESALDPKQLARFRRDTGRSPNDLESPIQLAVLAWRHGGQPDMQVFRVSQTDGGMRLTCLHLAPNDNATLLRRAGLDASELLRRRVVVFGLGAVGSQVALLLAESGVGHMHLVDVDVLRPGNVVRHLGGPRDIGIPKVLIAELEINGHAPWTTVTTTPTNLVGPDNINTVISARDLVVDTTGRWAFQQLVSRSAAQSNIPLISAALYRGGSIGRVRRQGAGDRLIWERIDPEYPTIPPDQVDRDFTLETGCSAPVSNAPPSSVAALAAAVVQITVDALMGRGDYPEEVVDVYRPIQVPPFDRVGRLLCPRS